MLLTLASLLALLTSIAILYRNHADLSTPHLSILCATISIACLSLLHTIDAEPWAYLLCLAGLALYTTVRAFHRKYHKISPRKGQREGSNRRARRRER